ncbi:TPA: hypothetical protein ACGUP1_004374 [Vibrio vulnificus]
MVCLNRGKLFTIDVLVSTYGDRLSSFLNLMPPEVEGVRYLIGHQEYQQSIFMTDMIQRDDIVYYSLDSIGVTKSRNYLLKKSDADIVYFCDDDISLVSDFYVILRKYHNDNAASVITFPIATESGEMRKKFPKNNTYRSRFSILSVGTIEISLKGNAVLLSEFPEDMGAGEAFPIGDEAVFLSGFLNLDCKIYFVNKVICSHPEDSSGSQLTVSAAYSRGLTLRRVFHGGSYFLVLPFFLLRRKLFNINGSYMKGLKALLSGIFERGII